MISLNEYKYRAMLLTLLCLLVGYPTLRGPAGSPILARILLTCVFFTGGWVVFATHKLRHLAALLGGMAVLGAWLNYLLPDVQLPIAGGFHASAAAFELLVIVVLIRKVYREPAITTDAVAAALCGYLCLGLAFGHIYCILIAQAPNSFHGIEINMGDAEEHVLLTYFSFITLTTVGYGDIYPTKDTARTLSMIEAVAGQFYVAVLIADLVGKRVAQAIRPRHPHEGSLDP
jgi:hypothetical protein